MEDVQKLFMINMKLIRNPIIQAVSFKSEQDLAT